MPMFEFRTFAFSDWVNKGLPFAANTNKDIQYWSDVVKNLRELGVRGVTVWACLTYHNGQGLPQCTDCHSSTLVLVMPDAPSLELIAYIANLESKVWATQSEGAEKSDLLFLRWS